MAYVINERVSFWLHDCCGDWEGWALANRFNHTSEVTAVTPAERPKSVRNRCVIDAFGGVFFFVVTLIFGFFCGYIVDFVIGPSQISSLFLLNLINLYNNNKYNNLLH